MATHIYLYLSSGGVNCTVPSANETIRPVVVFCFISSAREKTLNDMTRQPACDASIVASQLDELSLEPSHFRHSNICE